LEDLLSQSDAAKSTHNKLSSHVVKEGWLTKESGKSTISIPRAIPGMRKSLISKANPIGKQFQKRWFVLKGEYLNYYKDQSGVVSKPLGAIYLKTVRVFEISKEQSLEKTQALSEFAFELCTEDESRVYLIYAATLAERKAWCDAIKHVKASHFHRLQESKT